MPTPDYIAAIRRAYGQGRLLLPGVSIVVLRADLEPAQLHLLLTRRSDTGRWSLPAGIVEPSEQPATAALRELLEETRITAKVSRCFRCRYVSGLAQVGDEESIEVAWFGADELPDDLSDIQRRRIHCALQDRDDCVFDL